MSFLYRNDVFWSYSWTAFFSLGYRNHWIIPDIQNPHLPLSSLLGLLNLIRSLSAPFVYFNMIFIYSLAANTQNTYIWWKLYHLWSSCMWDVSGELECNTFLFCCGCRWEFLFDEQLIFSRCCRIVALQGGLGVLQMWVLGVLQIHSPDSRQLSLRFYPPAF